MSTGTHQYVINQNRIFQPRERLAVTTVAVAGFTLQVVEEGRGRHAWVLHEGARLVDEGTGCRHSVALQLGENALLGCLRRVGAVAAAARLKRAHV